MISSSLIPQRQGAVEPPPGHFSALTSAVSFVFFLIHSHVSPLHQVLDLSVRRDASGQDPHRFASAPASCRRVPFQAHSVGVGGDVAQKQRRALLKPLPWWVSGRHGQGETGRRKSTRILRTVGRQIYTSVCTHILTFVMIYCKTDSFGSNIWLAESHSKPLAFKDPQIYTIYPKVCAPLTITRTCAC